MEDRNVLERILAGSEEPRDLPLQLLKSITENFSLERKIGAGGFGEVYKGVLQNGCDVALKRITVSSHTIDDKQFKREVTSLLKTINHQNVVRFLGFCSNSHREVIKEEGSQDVFLAEIRERIICFEHIDNGSLDKHITDELRGHEWNIRYQVIMGICEGLRYLHKKHIIHMDLKPTNIMIDSHMVPKITDFGLSRPDEKSRTTGDRFGSRGYCAPEYESSGMTSFKCDIYSLGVIIAELATGRKGIPDKNNVLRRWRHRWNRSARHTPPQDQQVTECQVTKCIEIAERCMENEPKERPSISDIIRSLNEIGNKKFHISDQIIPPSDDDDMLGIEPLELRFAFELNKEISRAVELTNGTCNCIAFNIETVSQLLYSTQPSKGIVPSQSKRTVKIKLQAQETAPGHMHRPDEFIVQSVIVEDGLTDEDITEDMFNNEAAKVVDEVNLTVVYDQYNKKRVNPSLEPASKDINSSSHKDVRGRSTKRLNFHPPQTNSSPNVSCLYKASDRAVDLMTGAMGSLLPKLRQLLNQEHNLQTNVKEDVESLEEQLMDMHTALCNVSQEQLHQLDPQDKRWANKVRELSYDIEDIVDDLLVHIARSEPITNQDGFWGLIDRMFNLIKWGKTHYHIARTIEDIKVRVKKVANKHEGSKLGNFLANPTATSSVDPRLLAIYKDHKDLVGIDGPRDDLAKRLIGGDDGVSTQQLKIISIFGDGGLGKTTLAKALYDKFDVKFRLKAFVPVGRNPDMKVVLENILLDLDKKTYADIHTKRWNEMNLIGELQDVLRNNRYLIVIDDLWDIPSWEIIKPALIDSSCGSKIITTSRIFEVAKRSGEVCKLEPLSNDDSKELFCARLFGRKGTSSFDLPNEQSTKYILQKCGGVPLAIITIASLLADKPMDYWPTVYNSIGFGNEDNTEVNNTRQILLFSYYDLPWHLKTCLLYLSIFSEDREIEKDTLVWRWVAQGFVHEEPGKTIFKVGERYFHELINRSMIQPIEERGTYTICACRVHDMVLDMICSMAKEENFVTILGSDEQHLSSQSNARILAIQKRVLEQHDLASKLKPTTVRTFNATRCHISSMMSLLQTFQVLRVLSLEDCTLIGDTPYHLKNLSVLVHLRYLGLRGTCLGELPMEMEHLRFLQTLDLRDTKIETLPHSVTLLRQLKCLRTGLHIKELPAGMGNLTSLEELKLHLPADFSNFSKELGKLTELRVLDIQRVWCHRNRNDYAIHESLSNLQKIEELVLRAGVLVDEPNWDGFSLSVQLRRLFLHIYSCRGLPVVWMNASCVPNLCHLEVTTKSMEARDLDHLGGLSELRSLVLYISETPCHVVIAAGSFPKLRYFYLTGLLLTYQRGAMPCLIDVRFTVQVRGLKDANFDFKELDSLMYLPLLENVIPSIECCDAKTEEVQETEAAVRHAIDIHPNCPSFHIFKTGTCADEPPLRWMQQSKLMQALMPKSMKDHVLHSLQRDLTPKSKSNDDEGQTRSREAEESDSK